MILKQYTAPVTEPIHLTEAKLHLRAGSSVSEATALSYTAEDAFISMAIKGCRDAAETYQWRAIVLQTWDMYLDSFPGGNSIELPLPPLRAVDFVRYTDSTGVTSDFTDYTVDTVSQHGRVVLDYGYSWPSVTMATNNPVQIRFKCGYVVPFTKSGATIAYSDAAFLPGEKVRLSVSGGSLPAPLAVLTNYYVTATGISLTDGGTDIVISDVGTGTAFIGEVPSSTIIGMKLILTDIYEERKDTINIASRLENITLPRGAEHWFAMDTAKRF